MHTCECVTSNLKLDSSIVPAFNCSVCFHKEHNNMLKHVDNGAKDSVIINVFARVCFETCKRI